MPIKIHMNGPGADEELASLYAWLREDNELRHHASISFLPAKPIPGEMGSEFDIIQLIVDGSFQAFNLALAYATWRGSRRSRPQVTVECDGASVAIGDGPEVIDVIVHALRSEPSE